jgi:hypothetical protein
MEEGVTFKDDRFIVKLSINSILTWVNFQFPIECFDISIKPLTIKVYNSNPFYFGSNFSSDILLSIFFWNEWDSSERQFGFELPINHKTSQDYTDGNPFIPPECRIPIDPNNFVTFFIMLTTSAELLNFEPFELEFSASYRTFCTKLLGA